MNTSPAAGLLAVLESDDDVLVAAALSGEASAFVQLVKRYDKATRGTVFSTVGPNGPFDDALQEGLLKAYRSLGSYKTGTNFRSWLCRIVHNAAIDEVRKNRKIIPMGSGGELPIAPITGENQIVTQMDLRIALDSLSDMQRTVIMLVDVEGFDYEAAGAILDIPSGTVASRVNTARKALRLAFTSRQDKAR